MAGNVLQPADVMHSMRAKVPLGRIWLLPFVAFCIDTASAQSATTAAVGAIRLNLAAGTSTAPAVTAFALPFEGTGTGSKVGRIRSVASDSLAITGANWRAGQLADPASPYALRFLSGGAAGRVALIIGNTTDSVRFRAADLAGLAMAAGTAGDLVEVFPTETLGSLFGSGTFTGGPDPSVADIVYVGAHTQDGYYYNTTRNQWRRAGGRAAADGGTAAILPHAVLQVAHIGPAKTITLVGRVPATPFHVLVASGGNTYTHSGFPTEVTLAGFGLERRLADWVSSATAQLADQVSFPTATGWVTAYHNGINWVDTARGTVQDNTVIGGETPLLIGRTGAAVGFTAVVRAVPYSL